MDVSVVIPSYNRADLLPLTLDAVLAQTIQPREVIVVDDGSRDDTFALLVRYQPRVRVIAIENSGSIVARNVGLRAAAGTLVAFCDSDDLWRPDFLERMRALWSAEPRLEVAYANFHTVRDDVWSTGTKFDEAPPRYWDGLRSVGEGLGVFDQPIVDRVVKWQPFFQSAVVVDRATMLRAGGWDEGVGRTIGDDFGTVLRMAEFVPFGVLFLPLVGIRKHPGNFSANTRAMNLGDANILEYVLASRPSLAPHEALIRESVARRRREALESAFADGDFAAVRAIYERLPASSLTIKLNLKHLLAGLPMPLAAGMARISFGARSILR
ncbi:glycosyltransferase family 2 protein [Acidisphaera sp. S103]|uniref:glycosyltransferase family 2 protein n=1 Tax=Acidisphaera sp. S103 TaxID=1747223 RepID=UPI00131E3006|nr:glycosyltransferase family 2 protein [Acidisphaera sp. S103]